MTSAREIAASIGAEMTGQDLAPLVPASLSSARKGTIVFLANWDERAAERLNELRDVACVTSSEIAGKLTCTVLAHEEPKLAYCILLNRFYEPETAAAKPGHSVISGDAELAADVLVAEGAVIGAGAMIGKGTRIGANVVIAPGSCIGTDCIIKPNTTIGEAGFGFVRGADNRLVRFPHIGSVEIGNRVEIGANCTVVRAALETTRVGDDVKTDDHVHIAHNVILGKRCLIAAGAVLSGSVRMGDDVWVGPGAVIADHVQVGDRAWISLGSVVARDVPEDRRMFGNPARQVPGSGKSG